MFEIGNSLREARTRRGVEFAQAEQATKVRGKYLRALEEERFDTLPSETYVKGFLRTYADYLGLDGQLYVDEFNSRFVVGDDFERRSRPPVARRDHRIQRNVALLAIAVIAVLTIVVISAWQTSGNGQTTPPAAAKKGTTAKKKTASAYLEITAVHGQSTLIINRGGASGTVLFQGTLASGMKRAYNGKRFWLNIGSPENLEIEIAGQPVHVGGSRPWVVTVTPSGWQSHPA
jgi:cytoskeletal protein RodZ